MKRTAIAHAFVDAIPQTLEAGIVYVSIRYATAVHLCCCGCDREVVTPLQPNRFKLTYDGESVSLWPSIGNWSFPCQSHYWIEEGRVRWARKWSAGQIAAGRERDLSLLHPQSAAGRARDPDEGSSRNSLS